MNKSKGPSKIHIEMERSIMENMNDEISNNEIDRYVKQ